MLLWEKIKLEVRNLCIKYSKTKINEIRKKKDTVEKKVFALEKHLGINLAITKLLLKNN